MADIAAAAGCSLMTVSRALRDHPTIAAATRQRVLVQAESLGYRPDPELSRLMRRLHTSRISEPETIAWLSLHPTRNGWRQSSVSEAILRGAQAHAQTHGYKLSHFWLGDYITGSAKATEQTKRTAGTERTKKFGTNGGHASTGDHAAAAQRLAQVLEHRGIRGLLVMPVPAGSTALTHMRWDTFAAATCGYTLTEPRLHRACSQQYQAMRLGWQELRRRGYRRIGLALARSNDHNSNMWHSGFVACQNEELLLAATTPDPQQHAALLPPLVLDSTRPAELAGWVRTHRPDALIGSASLLTLAAQAGIRIPQDCAFAALNISETPEHVSGIDHHMEALGAAAIDLITEQLRQHRYGLPAIPKAVMVECDWHAGSTAPDKRIPAAARSTTQQKSTAQKKSSAQKKISASAKEEKTTQAATGSTPGSAPKSTLGRTPQGTTKKAAKRSKKSSPTPKRK